MGIYYSGIKRHKKQEHDQRRLLYDVNTTAGLIEGKVEAGKSYTRGRIR